MLRIVTILFLFSFFKTTLAQNLDKLGADDALSVSGNLNHTFLLATSYNKPLHRDPFRMLFSGSCAINILDFNLPFSFTYSNRTISYTQPFNQLQFAPTYKWLKLKMGNLNEQHSKYTLSGVNLNGIVLELSPKNWKVNLIHAKVIDGLTGTNDFEISTPLLKRSLQAIAVQHRDGVNSFQVDVLRAKDQILSKNFLEFVSPEENIVFGTNYLLNLGKNTSLELTQGFSVYTSNTIFSMEKNSFINHLFSYNKTTRFDKAISASINHKVKQIDFGLSAEHIDPEYKTMGSYFFQNNLRNISLRSAFKIKKKIQVQLSAGLQENNFKHKTLAKTYRNTCSITFNYMLGKKFLLQGMYSNFSSITNRNPIYNPNQIILVPDTLNFYQIQQNGNIMMSVSVSERTRLSLISNYSSSSQLVADKYKPGLTNSENVIQSINNVISLSYRSKNKKHSSSLNSGNNLFIREGDQSLNFLIGLKHDYKSKQGCVISIGSSGNSKMKLETLHFNHFLNVSHNISISKTEKHELKINFRFQLQQHLTNSSFEAFSNLSISYGF